MISSRIPSLVALVIKIKKNTKIVKNLPRSSQDSTLIASKACSTVLITCTEKRDVGKVYASHRLKHCKM